jgi:hypothetical protein
MVFMSYIFAKRVGLNVGWVSELEIGTQHSHILASLISDHAYAYYRRLHYHHQFVARLTITGDEQLHPVLFMCSKKIGNSKFSFNITG